MPGKVGKQIRQGDGGAKGRGGADEVGEVQVAAEGRERVGVAEGLKSALHPDAPPFILF